MSVVRMIVNVTAMAEKMLKCNRAPKFVAVAYNPAAKWHQWHSAAHISLLYWLLH